jgi:hypothetical protein
MRYYVNIVWIMFIERNSMAERPTYIYCDQGENEAPLMQFTFHSGNYWICPPHVASLLHHAEQLADKFPASEQLNMTKGDE